MSYPKKLLRVRPRRGINTDLPPWMVPPDQLTQGDNLVFRQGVAERAPSTVAVYDPPSVAPLILRNTQIDGTNFWIYASASAAYAVEGSNHTNITHASGQTSVANVGQLSLGLLNGVPFFNNNQDEPMYWDGDVGTNFVDLPGWTATESCAFMVAHKFHLFAFGIDGPSGDFPNQIKWSDAAAPGNVPASWTAAADNEAGNTVLSDTPGALVSAANLRASLMIYKNGSTHLADYIGGNEVYSFRTLMSQAGALCRHAVADINGAHLVVTDGDVIINDGQQPRSIVQDRRRRSLFASLDQDNYDRVFCVYYRQKNEVWICYPEAGSTYCTRAMIYDVAHDSWGDRELSGISYAATGIINDTATDETWDTDSDAWDTDSEAWNTQSFSLATEELVLADTDTPDFLEVGRGTESLTSTLAKADLDFGDPERMKFVRRIYLRIEADTAIDFDVRVGTRDSTGASVSWMNAVTVNSDDGYADIFALGKYVSIEISATTDTPFKITGIDIEAEIRGYF